MCSNQPLLLFLAAAAFLGPALSPARAGEQPSADASSLATSLETVTVQLPDGNRARVMTLPPEMDGFLTPERIETCLATISEAGAWPEAWLVVQDANRTYDLVMRIRLEEDGTPGRPDPERESDGPMEEPHEQQKHIRGHPSRVRQDRIGGGGGGGGAHRRRRS